MKLFPAAMCVVLACCLRLEGQSAGACRFPGSTSEGCPDPQGRWIVQWFEPATNSKHVLWLRPLHGGQRTKLLEFDRSVDLAWSPDGRALAILDHAASNEDILWAATGRMLEQRRDLLEEVRLRVESAKAIFANGHRVLRSRALDPVGHVGLSRPSIRCPAGQGSPVHVPIQSGRSNNA